MANANFINSKIRIIYDELNSNYFEIYVTLRIRLTQNNTRSANLRLERAKPFLYPHMCANASLKLNLLCSMELIYSILHS